LARLEEKQMANMSIGGLVSGLDTATIISQLMQLEARPQTMLKSKVSTEQKVVAALQALNTKLASIATKAADLARTTAWSPSRATSSNDKVGVTADPGATPGQLSFTVDSVATSARSSYTTTGATTDAVMTAGVDYQVTYNDGRAAETINTGDGTLQGVADAINGTGGLRATLVKTGTAVDGTAIYELHIGSTVTGKDSGFSIDEASPADPAGPVPFMGGTRTTVAGTNAEVRLEGQATALSFTSNTITDLMPGVDVTLQADATGSATITVERDVTALSDSVKAMVESVNAVLSEINTLTAYDATTKKSGLLGGDSTLRTVRNQLLESVTHGIGGESLAPYGIQTDRSGKLVFDEEKFKAAYAADPAKTSAMFGGTDTADGLADKLQALGKAFSDSIDGTITSAIKSRQSAIKGMEDDIADWDVRLATRQSSLQRQYTALETALGKLQSQGSWLAGQLASLPQMSSGQ
jgi:flagellar hook-associated protein 2